MDFIIKKNDSLNFHKHFGLSSGVGKSYPLLLETIPDGPFTILDFGCGKGGTIQWLSHNRKQAIIAGYDCYVPKYDNHELLKRKWDYTFSGDVLEHIPEEELESISYGLAKITRNTSIHFIDLDPAKKYFPTGENAHLTIKEADWWLALLQKHWNISTYFVQEWERRRRLEVVLTSK